MSLPAQTTGASADPDTRRDWPKLRVEAQAYARSLVEGPGREDFSTRVSSAFELLGPFDSPAGLARSQLKMDVTRYYEREWERRFGEQGRLGSDIAEMLVIDELKQLEGREIRLRFSDGSQVSLKISSLRRGFHPTTGIYPELLVDTSSARKADGRLIE